MHESASIEFAESAEESAYLTSWDHLCDELKRLKLLLRRHYLGQKQNRSFVALDQFQGLVVSEDEVESLLVPGPKASVEQGTLERPGAGAGPSLAEELTRIDRRIEQRRAASAEHGIFLALPRLSSLFQLDAFEERCLVICLAPELDRKYEKIYSFLQDDVTRKQPSVDLVLDLLRRTMPEKLAARSAFDPEAPLIRNRLLEIMDCAMEGAGPLLGRLLKLDDRIVGYLLDAEGLDPRLAHLVRISPPAAAALTGPDPDDLQQRIGALAESTLGTQPSRRRLFLHVRGRYGSGRRSLAESVSGRLGLSLVSADTGRMLAASEPWEELIWRLCREAVLLPAAICIEDFDQLLNDVPAARRLLAELAEAARCCCRIAFLLGREPWSPRSLFQDDIFFAIECRIPSAADRCRLWRRELRRDGSRLDTTELSELAGKFRFTPGQIRDAAIAAEGFVRWRGDGDMTRADLHAACRAQSNRKLGTLASKIEPVYSWADIVLPEDQLEQLRELAAHVRYVQLVMSGWGFAAKHSLGRAASALFAGPSGTGKTMAAEIVADDLALDLYKIDLSAVVSKYIGETEKNLDRIFREAEDSNAILFFDEADALFGKRSEVKDAHDRFANIEIAYLLQKMEECEGVVILATNLKKNMDSAFVRRLRFIIDFPFPEEEHRERIWRGIFPAAAPVSDSVDFSLLARKLKITGGNIKNISLRAAYLAAARAGVIDMDMLFTAAKRELQKIGRVFRESDFGDCVGGPAAEAAPHVAVKARAV